MASSVIIQSLHKIPGNNVCVDCREPNPEWVSINLGVMMCLQCSGFHRNLGVHISNVRSVLLDSCWEEDLIEFLSSVGNRAFNRVWEAKVTTSGVIRPQELPNIGFIRQQFILRKYQQKMFMKDDLGSSVTDSTPKPKPVAHTVYQSLTDVQSLSLPSHPIDSSEILKIGPLQKQGGKDGSLFHPWQTRYLIVTTDGRIFYAKEKDDAPVGSIPLQFPPTFEDSRADQYYYFGIPTHTESEHKGRKFIFRCENQTARLEFIEAIRSVLPSGALVNRHDDSHASEDFGSSVTTPLEDIVESLTRSFYRWYLDVSATQVVTPPATVELPTTESFPFPLQLSASISNQNPSSADSSLPPVPTPAPVIQLCAPLTIIKEGMISYRSVGSASWFSRYCALTPEAFYVSSYTSPPAGSTQGNSPATTSAPQRRSSVAQQPPVIVVPLYVAKLERNFPSYLQEPNGPESAFAVGCPLAYVLLGADSRLREEWIAIITSSIEEAKHRRSVV